MPHKKPGRPPGAKNRSKDAGRYVRPSDVERSTKARGRPAAESKKAGARASSPPTPPHPEDNGKPGRTWREAAMEWAADPLALEPQRRKVGRAGWVVTEELVNKAYELARKGFRDLDIAEAMGIHSRTLYDKCIEYPQLNLAIKVGRKENLQSDLGHLERMKSSNLGAVIFSMKACHGYREDEVTGDSENVGGGNSKSIGERISAAMQRVAK